MRILPFQVYYDLKDASWCAAIGRDIWKNLQLVQRSRMNACDYQIKETDQLDQEAATPPQQMHGPTLKWGTHI
jgi:hypothetical protein